MLGSFKLGTAALLAAAIAVSMTACGGGGGGDSGPSGADMLIQGRVLNTAGQPVAGAMVSGGGMSTVTGADGAYVIKPNTVSPVLVVKKAGYGTQAKMVPTVAGRTTGMNLTVVADQVNATFNAGAGAVIALNGATVQIPANAVQTATKLPYLGTVNLAASYTSPDTVAGEQAFPQPYAGTDGAEVAFLRSVGVIEVKMTDANGAPLQLKPTSLATLTFPATSVSAGTSAVPLWYYDESAKSWVREGQVTQQANGSYQGTVSHFTVWNADLKIPAASQATLKGCFVDANRKPVVWIAAAVRAIGWSVRGVAVDGSFEASVIAGVPLSVESLSNPALFGAVPVPALAAGEVRQLACVVIANPVNDPLAALLASFPALPVTATPTPTPTPPAVADYVGIYSGTYTGAENGTFRVTISSTGVVSGSVYSATYNATYPASGNVNASGTVDVTATSGTAGSSRFSGTVLAAGAVSGSWAYVGTSGGGVFTGVRQ